MKLMELYLPICAVLFTVCFDYISSTIQHREGDLCDIKNSERTCQNVNNCPLEAESIIIGEEPDLCGITQSDLVCCDKSSKKSYVNKKYERETDEATESKIKKLVKRETTGEKSKIMCAKYADSVFSSVEIPLLSLEGNKIKVDECGIHEGTPIIIPGYMASPKEFPHMALIGISKNGSDEKEWLCGGSLISERWILSAAHCAYSGRGIASHAKLGDVKIKSEDDAKDSQPIELKIVERVVHPEYKVRQVYNNIALLKLGRDVEFNKFIRPICLNTNTEPYTGQAIATGWDATYSDESPSQDLLKVVLNLYDMAQCIKKYANVSERFLPNGITAQNMVCTWDREKVCQGFTGGPLQIKLDKPYCMYSIIGVMSFRRGCVSDFPTVHTRVSHYVPWIESIVWP